VRDPREESATAFCQSEDNQEGCPASVEEDRQILIRHVQFMLANEAVCECCICQAGECAEGKACQDDKEEYLQDQWCPRDDLEKSIPSEGLPMTTAQCV
jgi:hypothetical protein